MPTPTFERNIRTVASQTASEVAKLSEITNNDLESAVFMGIMLALEDARENFASPREAELNGDRRTRFFSFFGPLTGGVMTGAYLTMYSLLEKAKAIDKAASSDQTPTHIG